MTEVSTGAKKERARVLAEEVLGLPWHDLVAELADRRVQRPPRTPNYDDLELKLARILPSSQRPTRADLERLVSNPASPSPDELEYVLPDPWGPSYRPTRAEKKELDRKLASLNNPRRGKARDRRKELGRYWAHLLASADPVLGSLADKLLRKEVAQLTRRR